MTELLFNPFRRYGGARALFAAIVIMLLGGLVAVTAQVRFDGVIDMHMGMARDIGWTAALTEWIIVWLTMVVLLYVSGRLLSSSSIRLIDVAGMHGMARFPFIPAGLLMLFPVNEKMARYAELVMMKKGEPVELSGIDIGSFLLLSLLVLAFIIWAVVLMYRAYSVSCNLKGPKAIVSFIVVTVIAEIAAKSVLYMVFK